MMRDYLLFPNFVANACCNPCCDGSVSAQRVESVTSNNCCANGCFVCFPCCGCNCGNVGGVNNNCGCAGVGGVNDDCGCAGVGGTTDDCGCDNAGNCSCSGFDNCRRHRRHCR